jgi:hypothetical protein
MCLPVSDRETKKFITLMILKLLSLNAYMSEPHIIILHGSTILLIK